MELGWNWNTFENVEIKYGIELKDTIQWRMQDFFHGRNVCKPKQKVDKI